MGLEVTWRSRSATRSAMTLEAAWQRAELTVDENLVQLGLSREVTAAAMLVYEEFLAHVDACVDVDRW